MGGAWVQEAAVGRQMQFAHTSCMRSAVDASSCDGPPLRQLSASTAPTSSCATPAAVPLARSTTTVFVMASLKAGCAWVGPGRGRVRQPQRDAVLGCAPVTAPALWGHLGDAAAAAGSKWGCAFHARFTSARARLRGPLGNRFSLSAGRCSRGTGSRLLPTPQCRGRDV
jgi:hypothetical protein